VKVLDIDFGEGWNAPSTSAGLQTILAEASLNFYQKPVGYQGEGGSIPFMKMLGDNFPKAQFAIVGVLGPNSNAHGPNEFLHIPMAKKLTCCVSYIVNEFSKL
jgi:acetylornithine deacetylase/succinyl-diaminopimelate desuccinylase-like protein